MVTTVSSATLSRRAVLRLASLALGAFGGGTLLAACASPVGPVAARPTPVQGKLELWGEALFPFDKDIGGQIVKELETANPGLTVAFSPVDDFDATKLRVSAAGGTPPDLVDINGIEPQGLALAGITASFEPYIDRSKAIQKADLWPPLVAEASWKGALFGMGYAPDIRILYLNADRYHQAGLDIAKPPQTWDELESAIGKTLQRDAQGISVMGFHPFIGSGINNLWLVPFWQLGGELLSTDGAKVTIAGDPGLNAWTWLVKIINEQGGWPAFQAFSAKRDPNQLFANDAMSHYYATNAERAESFPKYKANLQFGYTTYPLPPKGRRVTFGGVHTWVMASGAKLKEGAWLFLETLLSEKNNLAFADRYDRVPVRQSVAYSAAYIKNDPFRKLVGEEMPGRHWLIPAPGAGGMRADVMGVVTDILNKNMGIQQALLKAQTSIQGKLDQALRGSGNVP